MYRVILCDSPHMYNARNGEGTKYGKGTSGYTGGTLSVQELSSMGEDISRLASPDAYLFYWVCFPYIGKGKGNGLENGIRVMEAWGFRYVSLAFTWVKVNRDGTYRKGVGRYVPNNTECVLMGVRGKPWHSKSGWKPCQVISAPLQREGKKIIHSRKPVEIYQNIEQWLTPQIGIEGAVCLKT